MCWPRWRRLQYLRMRLMSNHVGLAPSELVAAGCDKLRRHKACYKDTKCTTPGGSTCRLAPSLMAASEVRDRRISPVVRRHAKAGVPVLMITDDEAAARKITGPNTLFFRKPLVSDVVVAAVKRLLAEA